MAEIRGVVCPKEGNNKMFLIQLMKLRYREGAPMAHHVNAFQGVINQLSSMEIPFEDEVRALLDTWETLKVTLCNQPLMVLSLGTLSRLSS